MQIPEWAHRNDANIVRYAIPFAFGPRPTRRGTPAPLNSASASVVDLGAGPFLLTAAHVMTAALERRDEPRFHCVAGPQEIRLDPAAVDLDDELDVATLPLSSADAAALEGDGLQIVRPPTWPPQALRRGDPVVLAGFPGPWRLQASRDELDFLSITILALVHDARPAEFVCHSDPDFRHERKISESTEPLPDFGDARGLSGGPAFLVSNIPGQLLVPQLCGIVKEGVDLGGGHRIFRYASLSTLGSDGRLTRA